MSRALLSCLLCSHLLSTSPSVCEGARISWVDRAGHASATQPKQAEDVAEAAQMHAVSVQQSKDDMEAASGGPVPTKEVQPIQAEEANSKTSEVTVVADKQREKMEEQNKHKPVKNKRRPPPAFALESSDSAAQEVEKATTDYKGMAGKEAEGATDTDSSSNSTVTVAADKQREKMEEQNKHKHVKIKKRVAFALERPDSVAQEVEKATTDYKAMAGKEAEGATDTDSSNSTVTVVADKQREKMEEQNKHKPVKIERRPLSAFALEMSDSVAQEVEKATTDYKAMAGKEAEGATETDSRNTTTTAGDSRGKYKVGDIVEYKFGEGDGDWVDAQVQRIDDSGSMVLAKDFRSYGGGLGPGGERGRGSIVLSRTEWPLRVIHKLPTPTDMMDKLTVSFISADPSLSKVVVKGIAMQLVAAVTKEYSQFVDCTPFTRITKQQWAEYSKKDVDSKLVEDIFRGAKEITFTQFVETILETHLTT